MRELLKTGAEKLGVSLNDKQLDDFYNYYRMLDEKNKVMNLTAITEEKEVYKLHFLDCLALLNVADLKGRVIDIGSGAGFPGVPLKLANPELSITLLDSTKKRVDFLNEVGTALNLKDVEYVAARAEDYIADHREKFDFAVSRAVARMNVIAELCLPYVKVGGTCIMMKSVNSDEEIAEAKNAVLTLGGKIRDIIDYEVPFTDIKHRAVVIEKVKACPAKYPRKYAKIVKQPL